MDAVYFQDKQGVPSIDVTGDVAATSSPAIAKAETRSARPGMPIHFDPRQIAQPLGRKGDDHRTFSQIGLRPSERQMSTGVPHHSVQPTHASAVVNASAKPGHPSVMPGNNPEVSLNVGAQSDENVAPVLLGEGELQAQRSITPAVLAESTRIPQGSVGLAAEAQALDGDTSEEISVGKPGSLCAPSRSLTPQPAEADLPEASHAGQGIQNSIHDQFPSHCHFPEVLVCQDFCRERHRVLRCRCPWCCDT